MARADPLDFRHPWNSTPNARAGGYPRASGRDQGGARAVACLPARPRPVVKLCADGLELRLTGQRLDTAEDIASRAALGEAPVRAWRGP